MTPVDLYTSRPDAADTVPHDVPPTADVVVVGAGLMGSAAAWAATRRGLSTVLLEQFALGHDRGSSHGSARIVRRAYPDPCYLQIAGRAMDPWRELEFDSDRTLMQITGGIDYGTRRNPEYIARVLADQAVPHELLTAASAGQRWPGIGFHGPVLFHPQAGTVDAALAVRTAISCAERRGAVVRADTHVQRVDVVDDHQALVVTTAELCGPEASSSPPAPGNTNYSAEWYQCPT